MAEEVPRMTCGLGSCMLVCPANVTAFQSDFNCLEEAQEDGVVTLKFLTGTFGEWIEAVAERFNREHPNVIVEIVAVPMAELSPNIINEATSMTGLFDGFVTPPGVMGSIVEEDGWADLKPYIDASTSNAQDWSDIMLSYRRWIAQYQDRILMFPLDGDVLSLFYRKDILEAFELKVPRTWEEFNEVAATLHGQEYLNQTLSGSCIGRAAGCAGSYWANLVLSSMTQASGTSSGHLFDSKDMTPLLGEALEQALEWMAEQTKYGPDDEFGECVTINKNLIRGSCAITYSWGQTYKAHLNKKSIFHEPGVEIGIAKTPGSTKVLDRTTQKLVPCDAERCRFGTFYEDIGWVNNAPYLAFGGWACAVNNYTTPGKKQLATEFCAYAASRDESKKIVIEDATILPSGADPFRTSQLNVDEWIESGYDRGSVEEYFAVIGNALSSNNCVTDIRFPTSSAIYAMLDQEFYQYLNDTRSDAVPESQRSLRRKDICARLARTWKVLISEYDAQASTRSSVLLQYQKLRNVYMVNEDLNQLGPGIRGYGSFIASLTLLTAVACGIWSYKNRSSPVVKASQPFFLILISIGVFVFGSSIFLMAIDDGHASPEACDRACMAAPWLGAMGWSILFAALYAKIRRVNLVVQNAIQFRSVRVSEKDVMTPFAILFTANLVLLLVWTLVDPMFWERRQISPTESYGSCTANSDSAVWKVILGLLGVLNGAALVGANFEAWKARKVDTEYGESSYIGLIMASMLQVVLVGVPLMFLVRDNPTARFFVNSSMAFIISMSVLLLLFLPKALNWKFSPNGKKLDRKMSGMEHNPSRNSTPDSVTLLAEVKTKVESLEYIMREAGIEASVYIHESGLDRIDFSDTSSVVQSTDGRLSSLDLDSSFKRDSSLTPVVEEGDEEAEEDASPSFPEQLAVTPMPTRRSITRWLEKKKTVQGPTEFISGDFDLQDGTKDFGLSMERSDSVRVDMTGSVASPSPANS